ncbi:MAG TPA: FtsW/RodA/SpoVE family cell cycle protein, partial [Mycolicibacterium fallax]|nr:FtsW/RodA/SpoVE family cell cycle protein [Mycolicibacterium fallax]
MPALLDRLRRQPAAAAPGAETAEQSPDAASTGQSAAGTSSTDAGRARVSLADSRFGQWLGKPMTSFHLVIAIAALLVTLGLIMVLSASGVYSYDLDGSPWRLFGRQVLWTASGLLAF